MREFAPLPVDSLWVEQTLGRMTLDQKIAQLLHPSIVPDASEQDREAALGGVEPGGIFLFSGTADQLRAAAKWVAERCATPVIASSDLENGAGRMVSDATVFPDTMSVGAADCEASAFEMGRAAALEGRACGVHWSFGPVVDMSANPHNPITNTTCLGDDPERISRLSRAVIRGMQQHGMAAAAKHFPGAGFDDRDQHICNTINPLPLDRWRDLSGGLFRAAVDLGVWSIMVGHISLPCCDPGDGSHIQNAPPATLSKKIITDLLRQEMGFDGVVITDAMDMGGVTAWGPRNEIIPAAVAAGCDMILFAEAKEDFTILKQAVRDGRLRLSRIEESVRRILALKEVLGLNRAAPPLPEVTPEDKERFERAAEAIAKKAVTVVRDRNNALPCAIASDTRVLSYHFRADADRNVDGLDDLLRSRGARVTRFDESDAGKIPRGQSLHDFDIVLLSAVFCPCWGTSLIRPAGPYMRDVWSLITSHHPRLILVSFGSPYLIYEMPHLPCVINAYSPDPRTQQAVLDILTGRLEPAGTSPVDLERPFKLKSWRLFVGSQ